MSDKLMKCSPTSGYFSPHISKGLKDQLWFMIWAYATRISHTDCPLWVEDPWCRCDRLPMDEEEEMASGSLKLPAMAPI